MPIIFLLASLKSYKSLGEVELVHSYNLDIGRLGEVMNFFFKDMRKKSWSCEVLCSWTVVHALKNLKD